MTAAHILPTYQELTDRCVWWWRRLRAYDTVFGGWACDIFVRRGAMGLKLSTVRRIAVSFGVAIQSIACLLLALGVSPNVIAGVLILKNVLGGVFDGASGPIVMEMSAKYGTLRKLMDCPVHTYLLSVRLSYCVRLPAFF